MKSETHIKVYIDNHQIQARKDATVLEAALEAGIYIPNLCFLKGLKSYGGCRLCMVEIEHMKGYPTACTTPVRPNMKITTHSSELQSLRRGILELILSEHPYTCLTCNDKDECKDYMHTSRKVSVTTGCNFCPANGACELQELVTYLNLTSIRFPITYKNVRPVNDNPLYNIDYNLCILCGRCVRICNEERYSQVLAFVRRGNSTQVGTAFNESQKEAGCEFCGACVDVCPTGALSEKMGSWAGQPTSSVTTTCLLCSVACPMNINTRGNRILNVGPEVGQRTAPYQLCMKGKFVTPDITHHPERLTKPLLNKNGNWIAISYEKAIDFMAERYQAYKGPHFGIIAPAHDTLENAYAMQKYCRLVMGSPHIDIQPCQNSTRLFNIAYEFAAVELDEIPTFDTLLLIGSNAAVSHPMLENRIRKAYHRGANVIMANASLNRTSHFSNEKLIYTKGTEFQFMLQLVFALLANSDTELLGLTPEIPNRSEIPSLIKQTGVDTAQVNKIAHRLVNSQNTLIVAGDTLNLSIHSASIYKALTILHTCLDMAHSCKMLFLADEGNRFGANYMGLHPDYLPGLAKIGQDSKRWAGIWGGNIPASKGLSSQEMIRKLPENGIKSLFLVGDIPPDEKLNTLEFFVQQNMFLTETSRFADLIIPAPCFTELNGHIINIERNLRQLNLVVQAPEGIKPTWQVLSDLSAKINSKTFSYANPEEIWKEIETSIDMSFQKHKMQKKVKVFTMPEFKTAYDQNKARLNVETDYFHYQGNSLKKLIPDLALAVNQGGNDHG